MTNLKYLLLLTVALSSGAMQLRSMNTQQIVSVPQNQVSEETLPADIWEYILSFLPLDDKFLHEWTRTHKVSQAMIDRIVQNYVLYNFVPQEDIALVMQRHFKTFHGTQQEKQEFYTKVNQAFIQYTASDTRHIATFRNDLSNQTNTLTMTASGFDSDYTTMSALSYSDLVNYIKTVRANDSKALPLVKACLRKDLQCIERYLGTIRTMSKQIDRYANNKHRVDALNTYAPAATQFFMNNFKKIMLVGVAVVAV